MLKDKNYLEYSTTHAIVKVMAESRGIEPQTKLMAYRFSKTAPVPTGNTLYYFSYCIMARVVGFEPTITVLETAALDQLSYTDIPLVYK